MRFPVLSDEMKAIAQEQGHGFLEKGKMQTRTSNAEDDQGRRHATATQKVG